MINSNSEALASDSTTQQTSLLRVTAGAVDLYGILHLPSEAHGLVILANGLDSSVSHPHHDAICLANRLAHAQLASFQVDLFSSDERQLDTETAFFRNNVGIMQQRLIGMAQWFSEQSETGSLAIGYGGSGAVGAAGLVAAAERPDLADAVVATQATIDLAQDYLARIQAATLLISTGDEVAVKRYQEALSQLKADKKLEVLQETSPFTADGHLVARVQLLAVDWFVHRLMTVMQSDDNAAG